MPKQLTCVRTIQLISMWSDYRKRIVKDDQQFHSINDVLTRSTHLLNLPAVLWYRTVPTWTWATIYFRVWGQEMNFRRRRGPLSDAHVGDIETDFELIKRDLALCGPTYSWSLWLRKWSRIAQSGYQIFRFNEFEQKRYEDKSRFTE